MKKTIQLLLLVVGMLFACPVANAQNMKKELKKEYKKKIKEFNKEGWAIYGSTRSIDRKSVV